LTKLSKFLRFFIPILFLIACYEAGYWIGKNPEFYEKVDLTETEVYFYIEDSTLLSSENRERLATLAGAKIHYNEKDIMESDIIFVNTGNIVKKWPNLKKLKNLEKIKISYNKISPDFIFSEFYILKVIPLIWRSPDQKKIEITALQLTPNSIRKKPAILRIVDTIMSKDFQEKWIPNISWNTTIMGLDSGKIPEKQRPESIRASSLSHIQISK
jgi:hypothetical protein